MLAAAHYRFALGSMPALECLLIKGNPLSQISCMSPEFRDAINGGGYEILQFLKAHNKGSDIVFRMKLMFVGNGKTVPPTFAILTIAFLLSR